MKKMWILALALLSIPALCWGGDEVVPTVMSNADAVKGVQTNLDYVWTLVAAAMVFFMQAGFAMVEAGFTRAKNAVNIMMKNLMDFSMGSLFFWAIGFGLMFGSNSTGWFGTTGFFLSDIVSAATHGSWLSGCFSVFLLRLRQPLFPAPWPSGQISSLIFSIVR